MLRFTHSDGTHLDLHTNHTHPPSIVWLLTRTRGKRCYIYAVKHDSTIYYNEVKDSSLLVNGYLGTSWTPKYQPGNPLPWKVTKEFTSADRESVFRIEKYGGGRNSPSLITRKALLRKFIQHCDFVEPSTPCPPPNSAPSAS